MRCIDLCCGWLFVVVCRLALRLVALCVVRCGFSSCVDLCVALICVWLLCVLFVVVCRLALRLVALCVVRCGLSSCADFCVALICAAFACCVCCSLSFVVLRCVWFVCVLFVVVCCLALICALHCVALVTGHDRFRGFVVSNVRMFTRHSYLYYYYTCNFEILPNRTI